ncbi:MAG: selenium-dependent molybdenum cofactor biosynthesis protein YqeB [Cetobacterium sp.]
MLIIIRGAGDLASGIIHRLYRSGFKLLVLEKEFPNSIRRNVCFSECIYTGKQIIENVVSKKVSNEYEMIECWEKYEIPVIIDSEGEFIRNMKPDVLIDAILAKKNLGTNIKMAPLTIALGPGFTAEVDAHFVIETMRGHNLGKIIKKGQALENTGIPGEILGISKERVIYSKVSGIFRSVKKIGDIIKKDEIIGYINNVEVISTIDGLLRGIIPDNYNLKKNLKIADIDPRVHEYQNCFTISDKAKSLGGSVLEIILNEKFKREAKNGFKYFGENI